MSKLKYRNSLREKEDSLKEQLLKNIYKLFFKYHGFNQPKKLKISH